MNFKENYISNPKAFICEMISTILTVIGSAIVTLNVTDLNAWHFLPVTTVGAIFGFAGAWIRQLPWIIMITGWFIFINSVGIARLIIS